LPADIRVVEIVVASSDFHAQKSAKQKWYRYVIYLGAPLLFERHSAWQLNQSLKIGAMREAAKILAGRHDFTSFQGSGASVKTTVRELGMIKIKRMEHFPWPYVECSGWPACVAEATSSRRRPEESFDVRPPRRTQAISEGQDPQKGYWILFDFIGSGFLKQMVRNIVGTLVEVGRGDLLPQDVTKILKARDRKKAGFCAPPQGLYLMKITY
jgi:tRNA pseudouridine38-40 synthase